MSDQTDFEDPRWNEAQQALGDFEPADADDVEAAFLSDGDGDD